ncbi:MAG: S-layer homology domain-containing protein [Peptococcaceae bacterium]|nr:S-layer homology domain-containing protein [Peptococcaceae bacterium]
MKRSLVVVLTIAVLLFAFAGVASANQDAAAERLKGFGVIEGFPDGTLGLDRDITRAEFAKIAVLARGMGDAAALLGGTASHFSDVQTNAWFTDWINVATSQNIIKGYPDGTFRPNANITYAEAVTMILRVLGYNDNLPGAWPMNYLVKAADLGITSGVVTNAGANAVRGNVFIMLSRALDEKVVRWDSDLGEFVNRKTADNEFTLLQWMLGSREKTEGVVTANTYTDTRLKANEIRIDGVVYKLMGNNDVNWLLGLEVKAYHKDKDVYFVEVKTNADDIIFDKLNANIASGAKEVSLLGKDDKFDIAPGARFVIFEKNGNIRTATANSAGALEAAVARPAFGKFVLEDGDIAFAWIFEAVDTKYAGVVTKVDGDIIEYLALEDAEYDIDLKDYDAVYVLDRQLRAIDIDKVDVNSVIYAWENDDDELFLVVVNSKQEGVMTAAREDRVTVGGVNIKVARDYTTISDDENDTVKYYRAAALSAMIENLVDEEVVVLRDFIGYARHIVGASEKTSGDLYGLAIRSFEADQSIRIFTQDGRNVTYRFDKSEDFDAFSEHFGIRGTAGPFVPIKYTLNRDGEIRTVLAVVDIKKPTVNIGTEQTPNIVGVYRAFTSDLDVRHLEDINKFDDERNFIQDGTSRYFITNSTVIMKFENRDDEGVVKWDDIKGKNPGDVKAFVLGEPGRNAKFVVFYANFSDVVDDTLYAVAPNRAEFRAGEWRMVLDVAGKGNMEVILNSSTQIARHSLVEFNVNAKNEVTLANNGQTSVRNAVYGYLVVQVDGSSVKLQKFQIARNDAGTIIGITLITGEEWHRLDSGVVIWETTSNGNTDRKISRLRTGDRIVLIGDMGANIIKAVLQANMAIPNTPPPTQ